MPVHQLQRQVFEISRAAEYFTVRELQAQTGQLEKNFAHVVLKELVDNALDACETARVKPEITIEISSLDTLKIAVGDNGPGLPPETVQRVLNFATRTSDKAAYRSPSRGAQGNALKTIFGIPTALGSLEPVIIESQGIRHTLRTWIDPAGNPQIDHQQRNCTCQGTRVAVTLPGRELIFSPDSWVKSFALFNPHALVNFCNFQNGSEHANRNEGENRKIYHPSVDFPGRWRKWLPTDLTSVYWYDTDSIKRLVFSHIGASRNGGRDLTLRDFVRQFRGLSGTAKAKAACDELPKISRLSDFASNESLVEDLLEAMRRQSTPPSPHMLGVVGENHLLQCFSDWFGVKRHWYRKIAGLVGDIPFVFEVLLAETGRPGDLYHGVNFSPTYDDPLEGNPLHSPEFNAHGFRNFLNNGHASPIDSDEHGAPRIAAAIHLVCPALEFLDRGKTRLKIPGSMAEAISKALWAAVKNFYKEGEARRRDAAKAQRASYNRLAQHRHSEWTQKDAVFEVLSEAIATATGNGQYPVSARNLYYQVRPLLQDYTSKELDYNYFSQNLLIEYQKQHGAIQGLYYDPRGVLYEPHSGKAIPLGTREVEGYQFPEWLYNKVLYMEKKGLWPILEAARLAERYDLAVIATEGYASEAVRLLLDNASRLQGCQLFVLHDADPHGYNIARTLQEETRRMPGYQVEVIDLGLQLEEALDLGLQTERFTRKNDLPTGLRLSKIEEEYFRGQFQGRKSWVCQRVELNAFSAPALVTYIERKLKAAGALGKVVPPEDHLVPQAEDIFRDQVDDIVDRLITRLLPLEAMKRKVRASLEPDFALTRSCIEQTFEKDPAISWRKALQQDYREQLSKREAEISDLIGRHIHRTRGKDGWDDEQI
ncbi:MAG: ATP-binding protein [Deltaproteobacteria bacterium]|nr:ATP-binding protein [Deltaproteobacteria bacterium]MBM4283857.1 ATP-binding protein [Deltaproteobacteria bacterium]